MKMGKLLLASLTLLLVGCDDRAALALRLENAQALDAMAVPERVGSTPEGQAIMRLTITNTPPACRGCVAPGLPHYVYYVGTTVTVNSTTNDKVKRNTVNVTITEPMSLLDAKIRIDQMLKEDQARQLKELRGGVAGSGYGNGTAGAGGDGGLPGGVGGTDGLVGCAGGAGGTSAFGSGGSGAGAPPATRSIM